MTSAFLTFIAITLLAFVRNELAYRWIAKAIDEAHQIAVKRIDNGQLDYKSVYDKIPSYFDLMLDLSIWTYQSPFKEPQK